MSFTRIMPGGTVCFLKRQLVNSMLASTALLKEVQGGRVPPKPDKYKQTRKVMLVWAQHGPSPGQSVCVCPDVITAGALEEHEAHLSNMTSKPSVVSVGTKDSSAALPRCSQKGRDSLSMTGQDCIFTHRLGSPVSKSNACSNSRSSVMRTE